MEVGLVIWNLFLSALLSGLVIQSGVLLARPIDFPVREGNGVNVLRLWALEVRLSCGGMLGRIGNAGRRMLG